MDQNKITFSDLNDNRVTYEKESEDFAGDDINVYDINLA